MPQKPTPRFNPRGGDRRGQRQIGPRPVSSLWYGLAFLLLLGLAQMYYLTPGGRSISYSDFKNFLKNGQIAEVTIGDQTIRGTLKSAPDNKQSKQFTCTRVEDPKLTEELEAHGVKYSGEMVNKWLPDLLGWIIPLVFFIGIWGFFFRRMSGAEGGVMSFARSKAKIYADDEVKVRFTDVAGEAHVPFFSLSGSEFVEMFVGVGAARVRDLFAQAESKAPCIVFIDELDALGKVRVQSPIGSHEEREQTLNQLLAEMDGFDSRKGVIIMGATNRPEVLDPALLRPGRFDRQILVDKPDVRGREAILRIHTRGVKLAPEVDLKTVAARTAGFAGADLANLVNEAALLAARKNKNQVEQRDFDEAIDRVIAGLEKKRVMSVREREIVAYHESGHAIVATSLPGLDPVHKISIVQRGFGALGYTMQLPLEDRYLLTRTELRHQLAVLLAGRTAEEIALGEISTGAQNDLQRASDIARSMVTELGMSEKLGAISYDGHKQNRFLDLPLGNERGNYAEETAQQIDAEVKRIMGDAHGLARTVLSEHRATLDVVARRLLEKEVIEGEELREILRG